MHININEIKLPENSEFAKAFNIISDLYYEAFINPDNSPEEKETYFKQYFNEKLRLELGY